ncbi:MAG: tetratricopeptide repeat protein, partial [Xanthomonadales bacterium]|nr:tetratricopeptide repeat protein [Xanthomonadales bacterium]NIX14156.1 tetratricopeptide repeat protein [Xanthomonadales bacterium]
YGRDHPDLANVLNNMGVVQNRLGKRMQARRSYERSLAIREAVLGPDHQEVARTLNNLGNILVSEGELNEAEAMHARAL